MPLQRCLLVLFLGLWSLTAPATERVTYYHHDALGSPVAATDQNGRLLWRESYKPYGERIHRATDREPGYTGKLEEADFGISYFGARWYDPALGRFLAIDPVGFDPQNPQSFNRYAYANNNPYGFVDPDGRVPLAIPIILAIGLELGNLALEAHDNVANPCGDCVRSSGVSIPGTGALGKTVAKTADAVGDVANVAKNVDKPLYRYMSQAEADAVQETGLLRGGRAGETFWTDSRFTSSTRAQNRLSLESAPEARMEFRLKSNPTLERTGTRVQPANGGTGAGREYSTFDPVEVEIINVQPFTH